MKVYLTYDRYERNEWLSVYSIETNKQRAIKKFKEEDLPSFLGYGPDDCHSFQLQKLEMTKTLYDRLCYLNEHESEGNNSEELRELLILFYEEDEDFYPETLYCTDGCSDNFELLRFYAEMCHLDYDDDEVAEEIQEKLWNNDELYNKVLKEYIRCNY